MANRPNVRIVTLGCAKNDVDSEEIAGVLAGAGYGVDGSQGESDVTIINTCGFLEASKRESIAAIRKAVREKQNGRTGSVIVAGCLSQRMGKELLKKAPGADAYVGVGQMGRFDEIVGKVRAEPPVSRSPLLEVCAPHHRWAEVKTRARAGAPWSAYLKVSEGCDHRCTFCTIPSFRGKHLSKPIERVLEEARNLVATGAREINLIAQDVTQYGYDLYREFSMPRLLKQLNTVIGLDWLRLLYCYPNRLTDEVIQAMAESEKVVHYIDVPLQHAHPEILRRMKRPWDGERYLGLLARIRAAMPDVAIRSTFIVGFPGETESHFECLLDFMRQARMDRVGAFMFSKEEGTPAYALSGQVSSSVKRRRYSRLMEVQQGISLENNRAWLGKNLRVLVEGEANAGKQSGLWSVGRSHRDAPDIDGLVFVEGRFEPGTMLEAKVTGAAEYDLYAAPVRTGAQPRRELVSLRQAPPAAPK